MALTIALLIATFAGSLPFGQGPLDSPHLVEVRLRMLFIESGIREEQALRILGVENCILGGGGGTLNGWTTCYPVQPNHLLWVTVVRDQATDKMVLQSARVTAAK